MAKRQATPNKASVAVVDYVLEQLFQGRLKSGDRVDASVTKVAFDDIRDYFPPTTPGLTAPQGTEQLLARREAAQLRRIW